MVSLMSPTFSRILFGNVCYVYIREMVWSPKDEDTLGGFARFVKTEDVAKGMKVIGTSAAEVPKAERSIVASNGAGIRLRAITMRSNVVNINETKVISSFFF